MNEPSNVAPAWEILLHWYLPIFTMTIMTFSAYRLYKLYE